MSDNPTPCAAPATGETPSHNDNEGHVMGNALDKAALCGRTATIGNVTMGCENVTASPDLTATDHAIRQRGPLVIWENDNGLAYAWGRIPDETEAGDGGDFDTLAELLASASPAQPEAPAPRKEGSDA